MEMTREVSETYFQLMALGLPWLGPNLNELQLQIATQDDARLPTKWFKQKSSFKFENIQVIMLGIADGNVILQQNKLIRFAHCWSARILYDVMKCFYNQKTAARLEELRQSEKFCFLCFYLLREIALPDLGGYGDTLNINRSTH